jgi:hypothetical protein
MKIKTLLDFFIFFIILVKIVFIISSIGHLILSQSTSAISAKIDPTLVYWKDRMEFIFIISMSMLLIYYFCPGLSKKNINEETGLLFFLFGGILIFKSKWSLFITGST